MDNQEKDKVQEKEKKNLFMIIITMFNWMGKYWPLMIISIIFLYAITYARTLIPLFGQHIIDVILSNESSRLPGFFQDLLVADTKYQALLIAAGLILAIELFRAILIYLRRWTSGYYGESIAYKLRNKLYKKLQNADYYFHTHSETGDLIQRCTTDVEQYKRFISDRIIEVFRLIFLVGLSIYQMSKLSVGMTWISLMITPVILSIAIFYFRKIEKAFQVIEANEAKMTTHVQENVSGSRVVKAFANEAYELNKFDGLNRTFTDSDFKLIKKMSLFWSLTDFLCFMQFMLIAVFGIVYASRGEITLGMYTAFLAYSGNIIWPMRQLGRLVGDFSKSTVAVWRLQKIVNNKDEYDPTEPNTKPEIFGHVQFKHVSFKFNDSLEDQIVDINFDVKKGKTIAILGKTGSGKSTLMNLLVRLLDYQKGVILIDDVPVTEIEKHHLRKNVGIILQEPFLFSKTLEENIGIADRMIEPQRIESVAKTAQVHGDIINFENGYKTLVGERGITLSGGQKQRVAIARMLLKPKPILIFDDSLSAVDTETDIQIRRALHKEWKESTVFIITHRVTTAMEADMIIVLEDGKIKETGTHDQLVKIEGLYKNIWEIQSRIDLQLEGGE